MSEPLWKGLIETLKEREFRSPYLDRLERTMQATQGRGSVEREILEEMAYALRRAEDKINVALLECDVAAEAIEAARDAADRAAQIVVFNERREAAVRALWEFTVHREAIGLRRHQGLRELYPIPPRRVG